MNIFVLFVAIAFPFIGIDAIRIEPLEQLTTAAVANVHDKCKNSDFIPDLPWAFGFVNKKVFRSGKHKEFDKNNILFILKRKGEKDRFFRMRDNQYWGENGLFASLDLTTKLVIFSSGWRTNIEKKGHSGSAQIVVDELVERGDINVLVVNPSGYLNEAYVESAFHTKDIGETIGEALFQFRNWLLDPNIKQTIKYPPIFKDYQSFGLNIDDFPDAYIRSWVHLIGHSLGAQIMGQAGRAYTEKSRLPNKEFRVERITGLDPANPCFYRYSTGLSFDEKTLKSLSESDAHMVDVIHTNAGQLGIAELIGDIDFYPNGGTNQDGCTTAKCSHNRASKIFAMTIPDENKDKYKACKYQVDGGKIVPCNENTADVIMGYHMQTSQRGKYYLKVEHEPESLGNKEGSSSTHCSMRRPPHSDL